MITHTIKANVALATFAAAAAIGAATLLPGDSSARVQAPPSAAAQLQAARTLAAATPQDSEAPLTGAAVLAEVATQAAQIPLPAGGTFNGVNWDATFTPREISRQLQANAACQWWRAVADGRAGAADVARTVLSWPAYRGDDPIRATAEAAAPNLANPGALRGAIGACYGLQDALVQQAAAMGQQAPR